MATSSSSWSYAAFLSSKGTLYHWNPLGGLTLHSDVPIMRNVADMSNGCYSLKNVKAGLLECTLHPQELLTAFGSKVHKMDIRTKSSSLLHTTDSSVTCVKQHGTQQYLFMLAMSDGGVSLMDSRYTKKSIAKRAVNEPHSELKFLDISTKMDQNQGVFMGSSCFSRQAYMHTIDSSGDILTGSNCSSDSAQNHSLGGLKNALLAAAKPFGLKVKNDVILFFVFSFFVVTYISVVISCS